MRVDELRQRPAVEAHPRRDQRQRQRRVLDVAGIDDDVAVARLRARRCSPKASRGRRRAAAAAATGVRARRLMRACRGNRGSTRRDPRASARRARCARDRGRRSGCGRPSARAGSACRRRTAAACTNCSVVRSGPASILTTPSGLREDAQPVARDQRLRGLRRQAEAVDELLAAARRARRRLAAREALVEHEPLVHVAAVVVGQQRRRVQVDLGRDAERRRAGRARLPAFSAAPRASSMSV